MIYSLLCFLFWGCADLFYKRANDNAKDKYSDIKTTIIVGIVMGIHAVIYLLINGVSFSPIDVLKYLPVSLCYIISMFIGYKGLKYLSTNGRTYKSGESGCSTRVSVGCFEIKKSLHRSRCVPG